MPDDIAGGYDPVGDMWVSSEDSDTEIKAGCGVRLRIIGVTVGAELVRSRGAFVVKFCFVFTVARVLVVLLTVACFFIAVGGIMGPRARTAKSGLSPVCSGSIV